MKSTLIFMVFVLAVLGFLYAVSGKQYSQMPADANHLGVTDIAACQECHDAGKQYARKPAHPPKFECLKCHKQKQQKNA
ncbi:MAG: hypothetical protein HZB31_10825 [Nitrospirae bacterium]|nr:hypothetical protein [Nitrospirota bacterium]